MPQKWISSGGISRRAPSIQAMYQSATLGEMIFGVAETIEIVSELVPLRRGDIISMGTPSGVGIGFTPPRFLADGDEIVCAIEGLGELRNVVRLVDSVEAA